MIGRQIEALQASPEFNRNMSERGIEVFNRLAKECFEADNRKLDKSSIIDLRIVNKLPIPLDKDYWNKAIDNSGAEWKKVSYDTASSIMHKGIYYRPLYSEDKCIEESSLSNFVEVLDITAGRNNLNMMRISHIDISKYDTSELPLDDAVNKIVLHSKNDYTKDSELTFSYTTLNPATTTDMKLSREQLEHALAAIGKPQGLELDGFLKFPEKNKALEKPERE